MKKYVVAAVFLFAVILLARRISTVHAADALDHGRPEPVALGLHWARDFAPAQGHGRNPNMLWHNGAIMPSTYTQAIFWGTSWATSPGDKITGIDSWYTGFGGSNYAGTSNEYSGTNGQVTSSVSYSRHAVDTNSASGGRSPCSHLAAI